MANCGSDSPTAPVAAAPSPAASDAAPPAGGGGDGLTAQSVGRAQILATSVKTCTPRPGGRWGPYSSDNLEIVAVSATEREIRIPENGRYNDGGSAAGRCSGIANPGGNTGTASNGWQNLFADVSPLRGGNPSALAVKWDADGTLGFNYDARANDSAYTGDRKSVGLHINGSSVVWTVVIVEDEAAPTPVPQQEPVPQQQPVRQQQVVNSLADPQNATGTSTMYLSCGYPYRPHAESGPRPRMSARAEGGDFVVDTYEGCNLAEIYDGGVLIGTGAPTFDASVPTGWTAVWSDHVNGTLTGMHRGKDNIGWSVDGTSNEIRLSGFLTVTTDDNVVSKATQPGGLATAEIEAYEDIRLPFRIGTADVLLRVWDDDLILIGVEGQPDQPDLPAGPASVEFSTEVRHSSGIRLHTEWLRLTAKPGATPTADYANGSTVIVYVGAAAGLARAGNAWQITTGGSCARDVARALRSDPDAANFDIEASDYCLPQYGTLAPATKMLSGGRDAVDGEYSYLRFLVSRNDNVLGYGFNIQVWQNEPNQKWWTVTIPAETAFKWFQIPGRSLPCDYRVEVWALGGVPMNTWLSTHVRLEKSGNSLPNICPNS